MLIVNHPPPVPRQSMTALVLLLVLSSFAAAVQVGNAQAQEVPSTSCGNWVDHLRPHGFSVAVRSMEDPDPVKVTYGVPPALASCHTALVEGYVIEGHEPAPDIRRLPDQRPAARGLAVPGVPAGKPGMESGGREPYDVLIFDASGTTQVFAKY